MDEKERFTRKIGSRLKAMRQAAGLTQRDAAIKLGTTERSLSAWETGSVGMELYDACRLASAYGFKPEDIFANKLSASSKSAST